MSTFIVNRPATEVATVQNQIAAERANNLRTAKKMVIRPVGQDSGLTVPYAPREVNFTDQASTWGTVTRTGQPPLVVKESDNADRMGFTLFFGSTDPDRSVVNQIQKLVRYAEKDTPLKINYSTMEEGEWHLTSMSTTSAVRRPSDHEIVQAAVEVEFTRSTGGADGIGPVTGGKGKGKGDDSGGRIVYHVVKKGDTLHSIAIKFFKDASRWKDIAKWNKIKDPRAKKGLKAGKKLKIKLPKRKAKKKPPPKKPPKKGGK